MHGAPSGTKQNPPEQARLLWQSVESSQGSRIPEGEVHEPPMHASFSHSALPAQVLPSRLRQVLSTQMPLEHSVPFAHSSSTSRPVHVASPKQLEQVSGPGALRTSAHVPLLQSRHVSPQREGQHTPSVQKPLTHSLSEAQT